MINAKPHQREWSVEPSLRPRRLDGNQLHAQPACGEAHAQSPDGVRRCIGHSTTTEARTRLEAEAFSPPHSHILLDQHEPVELSGDRVQVSNDCV
jgi:hypothetical protein